MRRVDRSAGIAGAATLSAIFLSSCSGHHSISNASASNAYLPAAPIAESSGKTVNTKAATLRVTDLDGGVEATDAQSKALPLVNGSRLRVSLRGNSVRSAAVEAGDNSAALEPTGEGQWTAVIRFVDSSNPPVQNPVLEVKMQTNAGQRVLRIPVLELHQ
jgi:hypothetical protein